MEINYDEKIEKLKVEKQNLLRKKSNDSNVSRKERASHLIQKGALLEIAGIDKVDNEILLGYFLWFKDIPEAKIEKLRMRGKEEFDRRAKNKKI